MIGYCKKIKWEILSECDCYNCDNIKWIKYNNNYLCEYWCDSYFFKYDEKFVYCNKCGEKCITQTNTKEYDEFLKKNYGKGII